MTEDDIRHYLLRLNAAPERTALRAVDLFPHADGASHPWRATATDGAVYLVKYVGNPQEVWLAPEQEQPQRIVVKELVCGRLGHLFMPAVTPASSVVNLPSALIAETQKKHADAPPAGPSVGIQYLAGTSYGHEQWADLVHRPIDTHGLARIVVYMLWLNALDPEILVEDMAEDAGGRLYSIDHGWYLTGQGWNHRQSYAPLLQLSLSALPPFYSPLLACINDTALSDAAQQLQHMATERIIEQFAHVPVAWSAEPAFLARVAWFVLQRREATLKAIKEYLSSTPPLEPRGWR
jgi:hypothetical protein